ncbi:MAG: TIGR02757 family protein [Bacteroidia bacterium]|nr:TIGR02757 family protein [Bacteroidia bacterium]
MPVPDKILFELLEEKHNQYNTPDFIAEDPISIPHLFTRKEDIEIAGFLSALIAWGKRSLILKGAKKMMEIMEYSPFDFIMNASDKELSYWNGYVYRTFQDTDVKAITQALKRIYKETGGLEEIFRPVFPDDNQQDEPAYYAILQARKYLTQSPDFPERTQKHLANPAKGASAKRLNMFLRWMVRKDYRGVDFGIWNCLTPAQLICPLDVHTGNMGRKLGLLLSPQDNWKSAVSLTESLRHYCKEDPVKYDFALFGLGIYDKL